MSNSNTIVGNVKMVLNLIFVFEFEFEFLRHESI